ncbi:MAG: hypothetical protein AAF479_14895 [Pseudomonadota bacterium]
MVARLIILLLSVSVLACAPPRDIESEKKVVSELPKSCPIPSGILNLLKAGPGLTIAKDSVYPCRSHETFFGRKDAFGKKSGWLGQGDAEFMQLRMRLYDSKEGIDLNDAFAVFRTRKIDFPHTESRTTEMHNGFQFLISNIAHDYSGRELFLITIAVPLIECYRRELFCYDYLAFGLYPRFPYGDNRDEMVTLAKRFIDGLGGRNLAKPQS